MRQAILPQRVMKMHLPPLWLHSLRLWRYQAHLHAYLKHPSAWVARWARRRRRGQKAGRWVGKSGPEGANRPHLPALWWDGGKRGWKMEDREWQNAGWLREAGRPVRNRYRDRMVYRLYSALFGILRLYSPFGKEGGVGMAGGTPALLWRPLTFSTVSSARRHARLGG